MNVTLDRTSKNTTPTLTFYAENVNYKFFLYINIILKYNVLENQKFTIYFLLMILLDLCKKFNLS